MAKDTNAVIKTVLIIDDERDIVTILEHMLKSAGYNVSSFTDSETALQHFEQKADGYDLVLSDIRMPKIGGFELARIVRRMNPKVRIVLMTAFEVNESEFEKVMPSTKIDGFVQKPIKVHDLMPVIQKVIG